MAKTIVRTSVSQRGARHGMSGRLSDILLNTALLTLPMLGFSATLMGLVYYYRVRQPKSVFPTTLRGQAEEPGYYYVNFSATRLIFVASWSSTFVTVLMSCVMALWSYQAATALLKRSRAQSYRKLPTPYQFVLLLSMLGGSSFQAIWMWTKYIFGWRGKRQSIASPVKAAIFLLFFANFLGFIVFAADTWLHTAVKTVPFMDLQPLGQTLRYSMGLDSFCQTPHSNPYTSCAINPAATNIFLMNASVALPVLNNMSDTLTIATYNAANPYAYITPKLRAEEAAKYDYEATTIAVQTQCKPLAQQCNMNTMTGAGAFFTCNSKWAGGISSTANYTYFDDASFSRPINSSTRTPDTASSFYFGWSGLINSHGGGGPIQNGNDKDVGIAMHGGIAFVLGCQTSVFNARYTSRNSTVVDFTTTPANGSLTSFVQGPIMVIPSIAEPYLQQAMSVAAFADRATDMANAMANGYSRAALSMVAGMLEQRPALRAEQRTALLVARVPKAPLFTLVGGNLSFALLGLVLATLALVVPGQEAREVQARLGVVGLVAECFEGKDSDEAATEIEELFDEYKGFEGARVRFEEDDGQRQGGFRAVRAGALLS